MFLTRQSDRHKPSFYFVHLSLTSCPAPSLSASIQSGEADRLPGRGELAADGGADAGEGALQHAKPPQRPVTHQPHQTVHH